MAEPDHSRQPFSEQPSTRRAFLRRTGLGAAGLVIGGPALLASCSSSASHAHEVRVYNAPLAIDDTTLTLFGTQTGVFLRYHEYTDPAAYLTQMSAALGAHRDIGADVMVLPDLQTAQAIEAGFVRALPGNPPRAKLVPQFLNPRFDPGRRFSVPWSSTMVGIAYDRRHLHTPVTSTGALFDPSFKGKVVLSADPAATIGLTMFASGQDPSAVTLAQAGAAVDRVAAAYASGQIRSFATTEYIDDLVSGRALIAIGRSDQIRDAKQVTPSLAFVVPTEGGLLESTNMVVPVGARNLSEAAKFVTYMLAPGASSRLASFGSRVMAVVGGEQALQSIDPKSASDSIVQPLPATWSRLKIWGGTAATDGATTRLASLAAAHLS
jgi:spermidine/putrescine transport system substrate-binding protein